MAFGKYLKAFQSLELLKEKGTITKQGRTERLEHSYSSNKSVKLIPAAAETQAVAKR